MTDEVQAAPLREFRTVVTVYERDIVKPMDPTMLAALKEFNPLYEPPPLIEAEWDVVSTVGSGPVEGPSLDVVLAQLEVKVGEQWERLRKYAGVADQP